MFVLMTRRAAAAAKAPPPPPAISAAQSSSRTQNACDACRVRKAKCDGLTPCGRCRAKQLVCTSSRHLAKASGPVTEEHLAILQEQQKRLVRAVSNMTHVIKQAEARGFCDGSDSSGASELSSVELDEVLQTFAPKSPMANPPTSSVDEGPPPSKHLKVRGHALLEQQVDDEPLNHLGPAQTNNEGFEPFHKFLTTVQHRNNSMNAIQPSVAGFGQQEPQAMSTASPQNNLSSAAPFGGSPFDFHPQLAPFVDLVDWNASLEHFLNSQYNEDGQQWFPDFGANGGFS